MEINLTRTVFLLPVLKIVSKYWINTNDNNNGDDDDDDDDNNGLILSGSKYAEIQIKLQVF